MSTTKPSEARRRAMSENTGRRPPMSVYMMTPGHAPFSSGYTKSQSATPSAVFMSTSFSIMVLSLFARSGIAGGPRQAAIQPGFDIGCIGNIDLAEARRRYHRCGVEIGDREPLADHPFAIFQMIVEHFERGLDLFRARSQPLPPFHGCRARTKAQAAQRAPPR